MNSSHLLGGFADSGRDAYIRQHPKAGLKSDLVDYLLKTDFSAATCISVLNTGMEQLAVFLRWHNFPSADADRIMALAIKAASPGVTPGSSTDAEELAKQILDTWRKK